MVTDNSKANKIIWRFIVGIIFICVFPNCVAVATLDNFVIGGAGGVLVFLALTLLSWYLILSTAAILEKSNENYWLKLLQTISYIGIVFYIIYTVFMFSTYFVSEFDVMNEIIFSDLTRASYRWIEYRSTQLVFEFVLKANLLLNSITEITVIWGLRASIRDGHKYNKVLKYICIILSCLIAADYFVITLSVTDNILYILLPLLFVIIYCFKMRNFIYVKKETDNGSIFNRIPEEEYQSFLEKMK